MSLKFLTHRTPNLGCLKCKKQLLSACGPSDWSRLFWSEETTSTESHHSSGLRIAVVISFLRKLTCLHLRFTRYNACIVVHKGWVTVLSRLWRAFKILAKAIYRVWKRRAVIAGAALKTFCMKNVFIASARCVHNFLKSACKLYSNPVKYNR